MPVAAVSRKSTDTEYSPYSDYESMSDESDQDMTYEVAKGLYQQIRRRGDRERVRINSNPRPVTPCRSAGVREALEREVVHECPNCDVVEWSEPSPGGGERREPTICAKGWGSEHT